MMSKQLDWTVKLGDALIAEQKAVMDAIQRLRGKPQAAGNPKDTPSRQYASATAVNTRSIGGSASARIA